MLYRGTLSNSKCLVTRERAHNSLLRKQQSSHVFAYMPDVYIGKSFYLINDFFSESGE